MPQASDKLREYWGGVDDSPAVSHLERGGWVYTENFEWIPPSGDSILEVKDWLAIMFLVDEWDWGNIVDTHHAIYDNEYNKVTFKAAEKLR